MQPSKRSTDTIDRVKQAQFRAERRTRRQRGYEIVNEMFRVDPLEHLATLKMVVKWVVLGSAVGVLSGTASAIFLVSLQWATATRLANPGLLFLLPVVGIVLGWLYYRFAGTASRGNNLIIEELHINQASIPLRMAPMVLLGTLLTHLFGGSAGREGTAIQMGGSLADWLQRVLHLNREDRRLMLAAGVSGGFGSVFGTPLAGFVFGLEVQSTGRIRYDGVVPCLVAAIVGDFVTRAWGVKHAIYPRLMPMELDMALLLKVTAAGVVFGLTSLLFIELTHGIKHLVGQLVSWPPLRLFVGGLLVIGLTLLIGSQDYLGLSLPLIQHSVDGTGVVTFAFLLKVVFTAITLGTGFLGGEVTPLFVMGATAGYTMGRLLGVDPAFMASIGFIAVFAGASNTPIACALMGIELFGGGSAIYLMLGSFVAYLAAGHRSIYTTQRVAVPKALGIDVQVDESLETLAKRRRGWLSALAYLIVRSDEQ
ncbi:MAG: voltage-gated chloride channel family protein [Chloroflexota bacterium]